MRLKYLTLQGFKSFPEKTVIEFHEGVTAIVGPNGSGKSNITDAIRWVLGEQSVKTLRSNKMEELIFAGTSARRPLSFAEVTLAMDNSDHSLSIDYEEVRISRRIYRSGESEYLINDNKCRLKDVTELFLDTGIGRDGYSMIGQGRVDDVLSGKAELRRKMLDEAAGISKYKIRKDEADKKLAHTEQNLVRLNDILGELEKQRAPLERQAKKAKKFLELHDKMKAKDLALLYYDIDRKEAEKERLSLDLSQAKENLEDAEKQKSAILEKLGQAREDLQKTGSGLDLLEEEESLKSRAVQDFDQKKILAGQKLQQIEENAALFSRQSQELEDRLKSIKEDLAKQDAEKKTVEDALNEAKAQEKETKEKLDKHLSSHDEDLKKQKTLEDTLNQVRQSLSLLDRRKQGQQTNVEVLKSHLSLLQRDLSSVDQELNKETESGNGLEQALNALRDKKQHLQETSQNLERSREENRIDLARKEKALSGLENQLNNLSYQLKTQKDLQESYEGYSFAIRKLMEEKQKSAPETRGLLGPLANLLEVPQAYEEAISNSLGALAQNLVVETEDVGRNLINVLKERRWGRASFLPLNRVSSRPLHHDTLKTAQAMPGYLGLAHELVGFDEAIRPAVEYALARTIVVENLDLALEIARATRFSLRICTLDGDMLNPGGSMSGGSKKQSNSGILSRKRVLDDLTRAISDGEKDLVHYQEALAASREKRDREEKELGQVTLALAELGREEAVLESHINQYEQNLIKLQSQHTQNSEDIKAIEKDLLKTQETLDAFDEEARAMEKQQAQIEQDLDGLNKVLEDASAAADKLKEDLYQVKIQVRQWDERLNGLKTLVSRTGADLSRVEEEIVVRAKDQANRAEKVSELEAFLASGDREKQDLQEALDQVRERIKEAKARRDEASRVLEDQSRDMDTISAYMSKLGLESGRLEQRLENCEEALMNLRSRLWEDYQMTFRNKDEWYQEDLDSAKTREELKELRQAIKALGNVNIQAIEESKSLNERYEFMDKQRSDILEAKANLDQLIKEIVQAMQSQFESSFKFINEQFNLVFQELFGGGQAELILDDSKDVLNSNIDIRVSPPGKRLQNMLALSGGERCLTAIALLFAIQKLNPSPFCVLDEVEAALDEANIFRFTDYILANAKQTQYILVTHRRGTMEACQMIYGVSMQERGVSNIISVKLEN